MTQIKRQIREAAEKEEYIFYHERAPKEWLEALAPLGTGEHKSYLEAAAYPQWLAATSKSTSLRTGYYNE